MTSCWGGDPPGCVVERAGGQWGFSVTPDELMLRLSGLRRAQIGGRRATQKPLLLLWLFGQFAATGSARATYAEAANPVSQLINDFGPPVRSPALERQRAAMPFVHLERDLWDLRDRDGKEIAPGVPETARWLLDHGAVGQLRPEVTAVLADPLRSPQRRGCCWTSTSHPCSAR
jgi:putative restriction endonuclease